MLKSFFSFLFLLYKNLIFFLFWMMKNFMMEKLDSYKTRISRLAKISISI